MKTLEWVLENMNDLDSCIDARLERRVVEFMSEEQIRDRYINIVNSSPEDKAAWEEYLKDHEQKEWNEKNLIAQLRLDLEFGVEKALDHRGISSSLMWTVCRSWCIILENGLDKKYNENNYGWYGDKLFKAIDEEYSFNIIGDQFDETFYREW